jgi:hypothetical protein
MPRPVRGINPHPIRCGGVSACEIRGFVTPARDSLRAIQRIATVN